MQNAYPSVSTILDAAADLTYLSPNREQAEYNRALVEMVARLVKDEHALVAHVLRVMREDRDIAADRDQPGLDGEAHSPTPDAHTEGPFGRCDTCGARRRFPGYPRARRRSSSRRCRLRRS